MYMKSNNKNNKILDAIILVLAVGLMIFVVVSILMYGLVSIILFIIGWWTVVYRYNILFKKVD